MVKVKTSAKKGHVVKRNTSRKKTGLFSKNQIPFFVIIVIFLAAPFFTIIFDIKSSLFSQAATMYTAGVTAVGSGTDYGNNNGISATQAITGANAGSLSSISVCEKSAGST